MNGDEASDNLSRLLDKLYALNTTSCVVVAEYASSVHMIEAEAHAIAFFYCNATHQWFWANTIKMTSEPVTADLQELKDELRWMTFITVYMFYQKKLFQNQRTHRETR